MTAEAGVQLEKKTISKTAAKSMITKMQKKPGEVFYVTFLKRENNELRQMRCAFGIKENVKGTGQSFDTKKHHLVTVYDMDKAAYRMISLERLKELRIGATVYKVK
jgi:hypothetical protein